ncbi:hypothetical protein [Psychroflexus halocasei]|uniref:Uncharacterized protein n=1 Tax=Psychroflexus halocasei TaxID=908615 RepID=A0A1H4DXF2_9FLAO|nr:hypothetical protein [Psychroflexus halocasei]SEA77040.1 hypothetical protein SAMN05421540_1171 [Psychroflexus halocasei]
MKDILCFILLLPAITFSQSNKKDLYILFDDCSIHEISQINEDTLIYEVYQIRLGDKIKPKIEFSVSNLGFLQKKIQITGKSYPFLLLTYKNRNNKNPPIEINTDTIKNKMWAENIIYAQNKDFSSFFENFKDVYLVDFNNKSTEFRIAKRINIRFVSSL